MGMLVLRPTKWMNEVGPKLVKAAFSVFNADAITDDMAVLFVANRLTRLETMLLPHMIHKHTGREPATLAPDTMFCGRIGKFLRETVCTASPDPDRDGVIVRALLEGAHPWLLRADDPEPKEHAPAAQSSDRHGLLPEAGISEIVEDAALAGTPHVLTPAHAAVLALRAELYRRKAARLVKEMETLEGDALEEKRKEAEALLSRFGISDAAAVASKRTVVVPVNVTYYPARSAENLWLRIACAVAKDPSKRAIEEVSVDGTLLAKGVDIHVAFGDPIDIGRCLETPECLELSAWPASEYDAREADAESLLQRAASRLLQSYKRDLAHLAALNADHLLAALMRFQWNYAFKEHALRDRAFLCANHLLHAHTGPLHPSIEALQRDLLREESTPAFDDFMGYCLREGVLERKGEKFSLDPDRLPGTPPPLRTMPYEIAGIPSGLTQPIKRIARTPAWFNRRQVQRLLEEEERRRFEDEYASHYELGASKGPDVGRPFLLKPWFRCKGGMVLVHGYMAAPLEVRTMGEFFRKQGYLVYGVRLRGHGTSPSDLATATWSEWIESINRACAIVRSYTDRLILGGFSMGAGLVLLAAGQRPARCSAVFAINPPLHLRSSAARFAPSIVRVNALLKRFHWGRAQWEYVENDPENKHINYMTNPVSGVAELTKAMAAMTERIKDITAPTLIIQGSKDPVVSPESGPAVFEKIGTSCKELIVMERDRHGIINGLGATDVFDRVNHFLNWTERKGLGVRG